MKIDLPYIHTVKDNYGREHHYFRKRGHKRRPLPRDLNSLEFHAAYQEALSGAGGVTPGENRAHAYGTVAWLVFEFFAAPAFTSRPPSVQIKLRKHCEDFTKEHGPKRVAKLETEHLERLFWKMKETPAKANQWLVAIRDLLKFAVRRKVIMINPAMDIKFMPRKPGGHHTWTEAEVAAFRAKHAVGSKARLAFELHNAFALRRSDAILLGPGHVSKPTAEAPHGILSYTQAKGRDKNPIDVVVPMSGELIEVLGATPVTGTRTWLVDGHGKPFTPDAYSHWFADMVKAAGLPAECTPHGIRKRSSADLAEAGVTSKEGTAVTGHRTLKEFERYTEKANRTRLAASAMAKKATAERK